MSLRVSFIIPAYNAQKTLKTCLESITALDFPADQFEILLVDNNSTDKTKAICSQFPRVSYLQETRQGRSFARNTGAAHARGEFLAFVDADVYLERDWLTSALSSFWQESIGAGQGAIIPSNVDGDTVLNRYRLRLQDESTLGTFNLLTMQVDESPMVNSAACIYRRSTFVKMGGFDENLIRHEDIDLSKRTFFQGHDLVIFEGAIAHVIYHGDGWISYFSRSFSEGLTKVDYFRKWQTVLSVDRPRGYHLKKSVMMFGAEVILNLLRSITGGGVFPLLKAINASLRTVGRICGLFKASQVTPLSIKTCERREAVIYRGKEIFISYR